MSRAASADNLFRDHMHIPTRTLTLVTGTKAVEEVNPESVERILRGLHVLEYMSRDPITLKLVSFGGDVYSGFAIYDAIMLCRAPVNIEVYGACMSMAVVILQAGKLRLMAPTATMMVHPGYNSITEESKDGLKMEIAEVERIDALYNEVLRKRSRLSKRKVMELVSQTTYLNSQQAVKYRLADKILT